MKTATRPTRPTRQDKNNRLFDKAGILDLARFFALSSPYFATFEQDKGTVLSKLTLARLAVNFGKLGFSSARFSVFSFKTAKND